MFALCAMLNPSKPSVIALSTEASSPRYAFLASSTELTLSEQALAMRTMKSSHLRIQTSRLLDDRVAAAARGLAARARRERVRAGRVAGETGADGVVGVAHLSEHRAGRDAAVVARRRSAGATSRARRNVAGQAPATIDAGLARAARGATRRPAIRRMDAAQDAARVGDAGHAIAAVGGRRAGIARIAAHGAEPVAARD